MASLIHNSPSAYLRVPLRSFQINLNAEVIICETGSLAAEGGKNISGRYRLYSGANSCLEMCTTWVRTAGILPAWK